MSNPDPIHTLRTLGDAITARAGELLELLDRGEMTQESVDARLAEHHVLMREILDLGRAL